MIMMDPFPPGAGKAARVAGEKRKTLERDGSPAARQLQKIPFVQITSFGFKILVTFDQGSKTNALIWFFLK